MRIIIAGGRDFSDEEFLFNECDKLINKENNIEIVSGGANGADKIGEKFAKIRNLPVKRFIPNWNKFGKSAGFRRNVDMAEYADSLIAFWDGKSKGTKHMIETAKSKSLQVFVFNYNNGSD